MFLCGEAVSRMREGFNPRRAATMSKCLLRMALVSAAVLGLHRGDDCFPRAGVLEAAAAEPAPTQTDDPAQRLLRDAQNRALEALAAAGVSKETAARVTAQAATLANAALARISRAAITAPPKLPLSFGPRRSQKALISPFKQAPLLQLSQQDLEAAAKRAQRFLERERAAPKELVAKLNGLRAALSRRYGKAPFTVGLTSVFGLPLPQVTGLAGDATSALVKE